MYGYFSMFRKELSLKSHTSYQMVAKEEYCWTYKLFLKTVSLFF